MGSWMSLTSLNKIRRLLVYSYTKFILAKLQKNVEILANLFQYFLLLKFFTCPVGAYLHLLSFRDCLCHYFFYSSCKAKRIK